MSERTKRFWYLMSVLLGCLTLAAVRFLMVYYDVGVGWLDWADGVEP